MSICHVCGEKNLLWFWWRGYKRLFKVDGSFHKCNITTRKKREYKDGDWV